MGALAAAAAATGLNAATVGIGTGILAGAGSLLASSQRDAAMNAQREQQAHAAKQQAKYIEQQGQVEAEEIDRQKIRMRRQFNEVRGQNAVSNALGNVDLSSGSAAQVAEGNANIFADDMGENAYKRALSQWQTGEQVKQQKAMADYYSQSVNNTGANLLTAGLAGAAAGLGAFTGAGGTFGIGKAAEGLADIAPKEMSDMGIEMWMPATFKKATELKAKDWLWI